MKIMVCFLISASIFGIIFWIASKIRSYKLDRDVANSLKEYRKRWPNDKKGLEDELNGEEDPGDFPSQEQMRRAHLRLIVKFTCHDPKCKGYGKHKCHDLTCKDHQKKKAS